MIIYLAEKYRPDFSFGVYLCEIFNKNTKSSHGKALNRIWLYIQGTSTGGMIFTTTIKMEVNCYVDENFVGLYGYEDQEYSLCSRSMTVYVIKFDE